MKERKKVAFSFVADTAKHFTAVSAGLIALSVTFHKELARGAATIDWSLKAALFFYFLTVVSGGWTLLALVGSLGSEPGSQGAEPRKDGRPGRKAIADEDLSVYDLNIRLPSTVLVISFVLALGFTYQFARSRLSHASSGLVWPPEAHTRIHAGTKCLLQHDASADLIACALGGVSSAFQYGSPPPRARPLIDSIHGISLRVLGHSPARDLTPEEKRNLIDAYWQLDTLAAATRAR